MKPEELKTILEGYELFKTGQHGTAAEIIDKYLRGVDVCESCPANQFYKAYMKAIENKYNTRKL